MHSSFQAKQIKINFPVSVDRIKTEIGKIVIFSEILSVIICGGYSSLSAPILSINLKLLMD